MGFLVSYEEFLKPYLGLLMPFRGSETRIIGFWHHMRSSWIYIRISKVLIPYEEFLEPYLMLLLLYEGFLEACLGLRVANEMLLGPYLLLLGSYEGFPTIFRG